jgi:hypothetical protein
MVEIKGPGFMHQQVDNYFLLVAAFVIVLLVGKIFCSINFTLLEFKLLLNLIEMYKKIFT